MNTATMDTTRDALCGIDRVRAVSDHQEVTSSSVHAGVASIFLIKTAAPAQVHDDEEKYLYEIGATKNTEQRLYKFTRTLGPGAIIEALIFVPDDLFSHAEMHLKSLLATAFSHKETGLLLLSDRGCKTMLLIMDVLGESVFGTRADRLYGRTLQESVHALALSDKDRDLAEGNADAALGWKDAVLAKKDATLGWKDADRALDDAVNGMKGGVLDWKDVELAKKDVEVAELKLELANCRIQELQRALGRS